MKNTHIFFSLVLFITINSFAQVGINTTAPMADLHVKNNNVASPTNDTGISIPQLDNLPIVGQKAGQMIYLLSDNSPYYYNGTSWIKMGIIQVAQKYKIGDIKAFYNTTDHDGWVRLDGRAVTSLSATQQTAATGLGFITTLPDAQNRTLKQNALNTTGGAASITITQANLPSALLDVGTITAVADHTHDVIDRHATTDGSASGATGVRESNASTTRTLSSTNTAHTHTFSITLGGNDDAVAVQEQYLGIKSFIYLGN